MLPLLTHLQNPETYQIRVLRCTALEDRSPSKPAANGTSTGSLLETACNHLLTVDPGLKPLIEKHHCRVFSPEGLNEEIDPFRSLSSGIMASHGLTLIVVVSGAPDRPIYCLFSMAPAQLLSRWNRSSRLPSLQYLNLLLFLSQGHLNM